MTSFICVLGPWNEASTSHSDARTGRCHSSSTYCITHTAALQIVEHLLSAISVKFYLHVLISVVIWWRRVELHKYIISIRSKFGMKIKGTSYFWRNHSCYCISITIGNINQWVQKRHNMDCSSQDCGISSVLAMEILQPCSKPLIWKDKMMKLLDSHTFTYVTKPINRMIAKQQGLASSFHKSNKLAVGAARWHSWVQVLPQW